VDAAGDGAADEVEADGDGAADEVEADGDGAADDGDEDGPADTDGEASDVGSAAVAVLVVTGSTVPAGVDGSRARTGIVGPAPGRTGAVACLAGVVSAWTGVAVDPELRGAIPMAEGSPVSCTPTGCADPAPARIAQHRTATAGSAAATVSRSRRRGRASDPAAWRAASARGRPAAPLVRAVSSATASCQTDPGTLASGAAPMSSRDPAAPGAVATVTKSCSAAASRS
jgi:hypothetical protein